MGPKMTYLGNFDQKCLIWVFLSKISRKAIVIFEIGTVKFVYLQNFTKKQKFLNLGPKMPYLGIFVQEFSKTIAIFESSTLIFVKYEPLTHKVNFGIESAFSKAAGSAFSEGLCLGPGPLYKVCRIEARV